MTSSFGRTTLSAARQPSPVDALASLTFPQPLLPDGFGRCLNGSTLFLPTTPSNMMMTASGKRPQNPRAPSSSSPHLHPLRTCPNTAVGKAPKASIVLDGRAPHLEVPSSAGLTTQIPGLLGSAPKIPMSPSYPASRTL